MTVDDDPPDPIRTFSPDEQEAISRALYQLTDEIHSGAWSPRPLIVPLFSDLHRRIFEGVRDHAGKSRSAFWGSEYLVFGPHRSAHRRDVDRRLGELVEKLQRSFRSLEGNKSDPQ